MGDSLKPVGSGKSAFRWMISRAALQKDEKTAKYVEQSGEMMLWIGDDRRLVMYPCSNNTVMNFVGIHPSSESDSSTKGETENSYEFFSLTISSRMEPKCQQRSPFEGLRLFRRGRKGATIACRPRVFEAMDTTRHGNAAGLDKGQVGVAGRRCASILAT